MPLRLLLLLLLLQPVLLLPRQLLLALLKAPDLKARIAAVVAELKLPEAKPAVAGHWRLLQTSALLLLSLPTKAAEPEGNSRLRLELLRAQL